MMPSRTPNFGRDEESLTSASVTTSASDFGLLRTSGTGKFRKSVVAMGLFVLIGLIVVAGVLVTVYTQKSELNSQGSNLEESIPDSTNNRVAVFEALSSSDENETQSNSATAPNDKSSSSSENSDNDNPPKVSSRKSRQAQRNRTRTLPADAATRHPVSLLHEMNRIPEVAFTSCPNSHPFFKASLTFGTDVFLGYGPNKRTAKKIAAQFACVRLFNLTYSDLPTTAELQGLVQRCGL